MKLRYLFFLFVALLAVGIWAVNTSWFVPIADEQGPKLIAHRGVHQIFSDVPRTSKTCRARNIGRIEHAYIENTIPSIKAAFYYGADVVEIDVHRTTDDVFVVFHDWTLDCQTNGQGITKDQNYAYLKTLDAGYWFTDDGLTYPLRGTSVGAIPGLKDVFANDFDGKILVNYKSNRGSDGRLSAPLLPIDRVFGVYGGQKPTRMALSINSELRGYDKSSLLTCLAWYQAVGWTGYVPESCRNTIVGVPLNYAPYVWGWPYRFVHRMEAHNTKVILWGDYDGTGFTSGIDNAHDLSRVPKYFNGYIWTNRIDTIGPLVKG